MDTGRERRIRRMAAAVGIGLSALPTFAESQEYHVDREAPRSAVFISRAPIEEFEGRTDHIDGYVLLDGGGVRAGTVFEASEVYFEVDLASLDTGIGLRNRHMRDNYLEVEAFPWASFTGTVARIVADGAGFRVTSPGSFAVHGVERARTLDCQVAPAGDGWRVECGFMVNLPDHDIEIPRVMFLKLSEDIRVEVSFRLRPAPSSEEAP